jgi:hypothetical protein
LNDFAANLENDDAGFESSGVGPHHSAQMQRRYFMLGGQLSEPTENVIEGLARQEEMKRSSAEPKETYKPYKPPAKASAPNSTKASAQHSEVLPGFDPSQYGLDAGDLLKPETKNFTANFTHTWGDQSHNVMGMPSWVAVLIGGTAAALIVICTNMVGGRLAHPLPFFASDEQKLKDQIEQARDKVKVLESALQAKRAQEIAEAEAEAARQRGETPPNAGPSHDELVGEMLYRTQEVQTQAVGAVNDSIKQAAPLLARASHVQSILTEKLKDVRERSADLAMREAGNMYAKMKDTMGMDEAGDVVMSTSSSMVAGADFSSWFRVDDENELDPPPFALLLGGMFAPAQITSTRSQSNSQIVWNSLIVATCTACAIIDGHHDCPDKLVWAWFYGMLILNAVDVMCCSFIASRCASALCRLTDDQDRSKRITKTGNAVWDTYILLQANSTQFFKAYFEYQHIIDSPIYTLQKLLQFVSIFWGSFGIYVTCHDIVQDTLACDAKVMVWFMHAYSFFFLLFLTWTALSLIVWVLNKLSEFTYVTAPLMETAKEADEEVPFGLPLFVTLARTFLLRNASTLLLIKARQVDNDVAKLEKESAEAKKRLEKRLYELEGLEKRRISALERERKLIEDHKQKLRESGELPMPADESIPSDVAAGSSAGISGATSTERTIFERSAGSLFREATSAASSAQEGGFAAFQDATSLAMSSAAASAQAYADEAGLTQTAAGALASAQESATNVLGSTQQPAGGQGTLQGAADPQQATQASATVEAGDGGGAQATQPEQAPASASGSAADVDAEDTY